MANFWDLYWVLDDEQRALLKRLRPSAFDGDAGELGHGAGAGCTAAEGDRRRARRLRRLGPAAIEQQLTRRRRTPSGTSSWGLALAYAGAEGGGDRARASAAAALVPISRGRQSGTYFQHQLARIYILVGEPEKALDRLEPLLKNPYYLSPGWLRIDPTFDPLRKQPAVQEAGGGHDLTRAPREHPHE